MVPPFWIRGVEFKLEDSIPVNFDKNEKKSAEKCESTTSFHNFPFTMSRLLKSGELSISQPFPSCSSTAEKINSFPFPARCCLKRL